jgi:hypothetical protein
MICGGKFAIAEDAKKHIAAVGSKRWGVVRARHPGVSESTFWRAVRAAKADLAAEDMRTVSAQGIRNPCARPDREDASAGVAVADAQAIPLRVDYLAAYRQLFADVILLRHSALNADGSVRLPTIFDRSIKTRLALIVRAAKLMNQIYSLRNVQMFFDALILEIASESPDLQRRLLARLQQLGDRGGAAQRSSNLPRPCKR